MVFSSPIRVIQFLFLSGEKGRRSGDVDADAAETYGCIRLQWLLLHSLSSPLSPPLACLPFFSAPPPPSHVPSPAFLPSGVTQAREAHPRDNALITGAVASVGLGIVGAGGGWRPIGRKRESLSIDWQSGGNPN